MKNIRILIVEDAHVISRFLKISLIELGYSVTSIVDTGEEAIIRAEKEKPDLILMDIVLAGEIDGIDAAEKISSICNIPIIYLTSLDDEKTLLRAKITAPYTYIIKPFKSRELHSNIEIAIYKGQLEQEMKEREEWLATTLKSIGDAVISTDISGLITYMNPIAESLTGWELKDIVGKKTSSVFTIVNEENIISKEDQVLKVLKIGKVINIDNQTILKRDKTKCPININIAPIKNEKEKTTGAIIVFRDITEKKKAEEELAKYIEGLQLAHDTLEVKASELVLLSEKLKKSETSLIESNANKDKFFSIISHDLKSPFNGILGLTEMLESDYDELSSDEIREMIQILSKTSRSVYDLLEGLLEWAQTQTGRMVYKFENFDLYKKGAKIINLLTTNASSKNITLENGIAENTFTYADEKAASTVMRNLITNAIKFTQTNGTIKIETETRGDKIAISVLDNGIGMSEEEKNKLFKIEVHHTTVGTNNESGTGVGLILCKELVEKLNGEIWVESELGKGSKFVFTLPKRMMAVNPD